MLVADNLLVFQAYRDGSGAGGTNLNGGGNRYGTTPSTPPPRLLSLTSSTSSTSSSSSSTSSNSPLSFPRPLLSFPRPLLSFPLKAGYPVWPETGYSVVFSTYSKFRYFWLKIHFPCHFSTQLIINCEFPFFIIRKC